MLPTAPLSDLTAADRARHAHLADYAFRSGPPVSDAAPVAPRPAPDALWTLEETLDEIAYRDATLVLASSGVKVRHGHRLPALARNVARHETALTVWLRLGGDAGTADAAPAWDAATRLHAAWFTRLFTPPAGPLALAPGVTVTDVARYRATVTARLALGPDAAGAGSLRTVLAGLFARFGGEAARLVHAEPAYAAAA